MATPQRSSAACAYCGAPDPETKDHVPPKGIFPPDPGHLITVPCCEVCRAGTSLDDEYFKNMLMMRHDVGDHPRAAPVTNSVLRAYSRPRKRKSLNALFRTMRDVDVVTPAGLRLGKAGIYEVDLGRLGLVVNRTIRGLYYHETGRVIPADTLVRSVSVTDYESPDPNAAQQIGTFVAHALTLDETVVAGGIFRYRRQLSETTPFTSFWLLGFYDSVWYLGMTAPRDQLDDVSLLEDGGP